MSGNSSRKKKTGGHPAGGRSQIRKTRSVRSAGPDQTVQFWRESNTPLSSKDVEERKQARKARSRDGHMGAGYMLIALIFVAVIATALIGYLNLQAEITSTSTRISALESELEELRSANDETYNEINGSIDLEAIREYAINELGMQYADEDQIVTYSGSTNDYVHQVSEVEP